MNEASRELDKQSQGRYHYQEQGTQGATPSPLPGWDSAGTSEKPPLQNSGHVENTAPPGASASQPDNTMQGWDGPDDPDNPFNWPSSKKWRVTILACFITLLAGLNGTALTAATPSLTAHFRISDARFANSFWPVTSWTLSAGVIPLFALPLMETYGVRRGYLLSYSLLLLSLIPQALAPSFSALVGVRAVAGAAAGVLENVTGGIIGDVWAGPRARSAPVALYIWGLLAGLTLGPVLGGGVVAWRGDDDADAWRWVGWIQLVVYAAVLPLVLVALPETRGDVILAARARKRNKNKNEQAGSSPSPSPHSPPPPPGLAVFKTTILRPLRMLATEPLLAATSLWSAFCVGNALLFTQSIPRVFGTLYPQWPYHRTGLVQAALVVGLTLGLAASPVQNALYYRTAAKGRRRNQGGRGRHGGDGSMLSRRGGGGGDVRSSSSAEDSSTTDVEAFQSAADKDTSAHATPFLPEGRLYLSLPASFLCLAGGLFVYAWTSFPSAPWPAPAAGLVLVGAGIFAVVCAASNYVEDAYSLYAASALAGVACCENVMGGLLPLAEQPLYTALGFRWAGSVLAFVAVALSFAPVVLLWRGAWLRERSPFIREARYETQGQGQGLGEEGGGSREIKL